MWLNTRVAAAVRAVGMWAATADPPNHVRQAHSCRRTPAAEPCPHALLIAHAYLTLATSCLPTRSKSSSHIVDEQHKCSCQWKTT